MTMVIEFQLPSLKYKVLSRDGDQYFADGKPVTLRKALQWYAKMEERSDGSHGKDYREVPRFLNACAAEMKGGAR